MSNGKTRRDERRKKEREKGGEGMLEMDKKRDWKKRIPLWNKAEERVRDEVDGNRRDTKR